MELKMYTPVSPSISFSRKSNLKFCIIFNMISFVNAYDSVRIRLACSNILLLIDYFDRRLWNTFKNTFWWLYKRQQILKEHKMATINIFNIWSFFPHFFMKWECWCKVLCLKNCNHEKMLFFWWKDLNIPFRLFDFQYEFSRPFQGTSNKIIL